LACARGHQDEQDDGQPEVHRCPLVTREA